jgi:hypothetical protein
MWRLAAKEAAEREAATAEMRELLEALPALVPGVRSLEVGVNGLPGDRASDVVLTVSFDDWPALRDYAVHPEHVRVAARIGELAAERRSVDYETA